MSNDLRHLSPEFSIDEAKQIAKEYYNLNEFIGQLPSERDQNFLFKNNKSKYILKISNIDEDYSVIDMQNCAIKCINNGIEILPSSDKKLIIKYQNHFIRVVTFIPGIPLANYKQENFKLFFNLGKLLANIDKSLIEFKHKSIQRDIYWNMINAENIIKKYLHLINDKYHQNLIDIILNDWIKYVLPNISLLRISVIHNDANDYNIILTDENNINLIDFGDMCQTFLICESAIACAYIMLNKDNPIDCAANLIHGYHQIFPFQLIEINLIYYFIRMRLAMSVTISAHQKQIQPDNHYLTISEKPAWNLLEKLNHMDQSFIQQTFKNICQFSN